MIDGCEIVLVNTVFSGKTKLARGTRGTFVGFTRSFRSKQQTATIVINGQAYTVYRFDIREWTPLWAIAEASRE
jgi:hypothetical protein